MIRCGSTIGNRVPKRIISRCGSSCSLPIWINTQCTHPNEITEETAKAVFELLSCGENVGNQAVLLKGINDDVETFRELHQKLLRVRIKPYHLFYCEPSPGIDPFRTPVEKAAGLIRDALRGHTTGLAQPMSVIAANIGKNPADAQLLHHR